MKIGAWLATWLVITAMSSAAEAAPAPGGRSALVASPADIAELGRLNDAVVKLYRARTYAAAIPIAERMLALAKRAEGPEHPDVAAALDMLASLHDAKGDGARAEPLYRQALAVREKALGPDHPDVADTLNSLALLYQSRRDYARAEPLYQRALAILEKVRGADHPDVAIALNNLAGLYEERADHARAEPLYQRALAIREKALGPDHLSVASSLNNLAVLYSLRGEYARAEPLYQRALAIREKALDPEHLSVAASLNNLAVLYRNEAAYARAEPLYQRALAIREKALGADHPDVAATLNGLADLHDARGEYARAEPLYQRALAIREKALGPDHPEVAVTLNDLGTLYHTKGERRRAEPLYRRALAIQERALGPDHPDVATSLNNTARLRKDEGDLAQAEALYRRALAIHEKAFGPESPHVATSLDNLAALHEERADHGAAEPLYRRALAIRQKALGPDHPDVAASLNNLGALEDARGAYARAAPLYQRALAIREKVLGPEHPDVATSLGNLASLYRNRGDAVAAERLFRRALAILEKALGPEHPRVADVASNFAVLYETRGDRAHAEPLYRRALALRERAFGPDHPDVALSLNNLAVLLRAKGSHDEAEALLRRTLSIWEKTLGASHPRVATALGNLAGLLEARGNLERPEPLYLRALTIDEKALGPDHPDLATTLGNLAGLYRARGDYARAEPLYERALAIESRALGAEHPAVAATLHNIAWLHWAAGDLGRARGALGRGQEAREKTANTLVASGSDAQKRAYLETLLGETEAAVSLAVQTGDPVTARLALTALLRRKGRALDATSQSLEALRSNLGPRERRLLDELESVRSRYSARMMRPPESALLEAYRAEVAALDAEAQRLEAAISERSAGYRPPREPVTIAAVQAALPEGTALVEWTFYQPFNPRARAEKDRWGPARYAACVLPRSGEPTWIDLGDGVAINHDVALLQPALARPARHDVRGLGRQLDAKVMAPVRARLGDTHRLLLAPDGALNLVPFAALVGDDGHYLLERYAITYLTSGRDLLRLANPAPPRETPLIVADPAFGAGPSAAFSPLLHAEREAVAIAALFPGSRSWLRDDATEARLKQVHGPRLLHIGTHGFFASVPCPGRPMTALLDDPMLRSGVALAGANTCVSGPDDGRLTALEVSALDLYGTRLVVLSACETGVGEPTQGDGVYGLRRALVLAGAETQVMSLWPVDGAATADLMTEYYQGLARGGGRSEAMRQVQLALLHDGRTEHPYYWASFIVSGDDRALDGKGVVPDLRVHPGGACACRFGREEPGVGWIGTAVAIGVSLMRRQRRSRR
jgi:CHAT domain-containing protein/tetratricopeptide (TPR) repeat protein